MEKINELKPVFVETIPIWTKMEQGVLYISKKYKAAIHLCACGCGIQTVTPIERNGSGWTLTEKDETVSLTPSIGNFNGESPYHAHYFITNNKIIWC